MAGLATAFVTGVSVVVACTASSPTPVPPRPTTLAPVTGPSAARVPRPFASAAPPEAAAREVVVPASPAEVEEVRRALAAAEDAYFRGDFADARSGFTRGWERMHPNPLALAMAAHAARRLGDAEGERELVMRARRDAAAIPQEVPCAEDYRFFTYFDRKDAAWVHQSDTWQRIDLAEGRPLYGFCNARRSLAGRAQGGLTWATSIVDAIWEHPSSAESEGFVEGSRILLRDAVYGDELGTVPHRIVHMDVNAEYHGEIAFSPDRSLMASASWEASEGVRLWRVADRRLLHQLPPDGGQLLKFSPDGTRLIAGGCSSITVWDVESGAEILSLHPRHLDCDLGSVANPWFGAAISQDGSRLAIGYFINGSMTRPVPRAETGCWLQIHRLRDGKRVGRWKDAPAPYEFDQTGTSVVGKACFAGVPALFELATGHTVEGFAESSVTVSPSAERLLDPFGALFDWSAPLLLKPLGPFPSLERIGPYFIPADS
ncbi:MAG TPA: WD40 repeat domain-containing protein [Polyangiaceae bacterium]|nr:WD40 repeat domain-containing protein [Polyangiaceae bacterium]